MESIGLAQAIEGPIHFETGRPVRFQFLHNTEKAPSAPRFGTDRYQQGIEPAGYYMLLEDQESVIRNAPLSKGWIRGLANFQSPLVIRWNTCDGGYDEYSWKSRLFHAFGAKKGRALSRAILKAGYDAVVTVDNAIMLLDATTKEIVDLSRIR
jgi:hypothetical protein